MTYSSIAGEGTVDVKNGVIKLDWITYFCSRLALLTKLQSSGCTIS